MKTHVQNPWTRSPQVFVHMSVEEAQQLASTLDLYVEKCGLPDGCDRNQIASLFDLKNNLKHVLETDRPHEIKGVVPWCSTVAMVQGTLSAYRALQRTFARRLASKVGSE